MIVYFTTRDWTGRLEPSWYPSDNAVAAISMWHPDLYTCYSLAEEEGIKRGLFEWRDSGLYVNDKTYSRYEAFIDERALRPLEPLDQWQGGIYGI